MQKGQSPASGSPQQFRKSRKIENKNMDVIYQPTCRFPIQNSKAVPRFNIFCSIFCSLYYDLQLEIAAGYSVVLYTHIFNSKKRAKNKNSRDVFKYGRQLK